MKSNRNPLDEKSNRKGGMPFWEKMKPKGREAKVKKEAGHEGKNPVKKVAKKVVRVSPSAAAKSRGWDEVAQWYDKLVGDEGSDYHQHVIVPALMERVGGLRGKKVLDLCCGQGFLGRILLEAGAAEVHGVDASETLIRSARERASKLKNVHYTVADACQPGAWADGQRDVVVCLLAVHDVEDVAGLCRNVQAALKGGGKFYLVMMHPCFRIPQHTHWGWDDEQKVQYRRVDHYGKERSISITTHPGKGTGEQTAFYHRPLSSYIEVMGKNGLCVSGCQELYSHRRSQKGPRSDAEHTAAEEFPMFLLLEVSKMVDFSV
jgi:2-polyprenyl-3-methyl-5-hydroxy-6-metoxy-1,4-benzoquinol methylase